MKLNLVIAPDPIFRQKAEPVSIVDDDIRETIDAMFEAMYREGGLGIGANMVGLLKRIIVMDLKTGGTSDPIAMVNPEITHSSEETHTFEEASLSFPGISAEITRLARISVRYLDRDGNAQEMEASGFLSTVIQHECDYLDGKTFLDRLSRLKREKLMNKYLKLRRSLTGDPGQTAR